MCVDFTAPATSATTATATTNIAGWLAAAELRVIRRQADANKSMQMECTAFRLAEPAPAPAAGQALSSSWSDGAESAAPAAEAKITATTLLHSAILVPRRPGPKLEALDSSWTWEAVSGPGPTDPFREDWPHWGRGGAVVGGAVVGGAGP
jgi:hypothetical protein